MLIFNEGLPGAGKSWDAMVNHVLPALKSGRKVFAFIDGLNHERVAEVSGLDAESVKRLLVQLHEEDLTKLPSVVEDNAFVVIDEAQNYWPAIRQPLPVEMRKFVTEHRHRGIDILLMGQLMKDVHATWRGRVSQKSVFNKLDAVGQEKRYTVIVYKAVKPEKFQRVTQSFGVYDPAMFGMYASHVSDSIQTANYKDARATVWGSKLMKLGIPIALLVGAFAFWKAYGFFHPAEAVKPAQTAGPSRSASAADVGGAKPIPSAVPKTNGQPSSYAEAIRTWSNKYRPRLDLVRYWDGKGEHVRGAVEWFDDAERVQERQTLEAMEEQGIEVVVSKAGEAALVAGMLVTRWQPLEPRKPPYGAQMDNGQPATTGGRAGVP